MKYDVSEFSVGCYRASCNVSVILLFDSALSNATEQAVLAMFSKQHGY